MSFRPLLRGLAKIAAEHPSFKMEFRRAYRQLQDRRATEKMFPNPMLLVPTLKDRVRKHQVNRATVEHYAETGGPEENLQLQEAARRILQQADKGQSEDSDPSTAPSPMEAFKGLAPTVNEAVEMAKGGHPYTEKDPNFYTNWLIHLWQQLQMLDRLEQKRPEMAAEWFENTAPDSSGLNPDRPAHEHGEDYVKWVAEMTGDHTFPQQFEAARSRLNKSAAPPRR